LLFDNYCQYLWIGEVIMSLGLLVWIIVGFVLLNLAEEKDPLLLILCIAGLGIFFMIASVFLIVWNLIF